MGEKNDIKIWHSVGADIYNGNQCQPAKIQNIIYNIKRDSHANLYLSPSNSDFRLPDKIHGLEKPFIERVIKSFHSSAKNLGVLLNGLKGSGKTITSKIICNSIKLPILTISEYFEQLPDFINHIDFDCVILIDEYEKIFRFDERGILLSAMDGVQAPKSKVLFLLTTNDMFVNQNLLNRPSRIRYVKTYGNLNKEAIIQIVNEELENKEFFEDTINVISRLPIITIDLILEIIKESNLHKDSPVAFKDFFNCNKDSVNAKYKFTDVATGKVIHESISIDRKITPYLKDIVLDDDEYNFVCKFINATGNNTAMMEFIVPNENNEDSEDEEEEKRAILHVSWEEVHDKHWMF